MTSQSKIVKDWGAKEISIFVIGISILLYIIVFLVWNFTNSSSHRPTWVLWDDHREGFVQDPLDDRFKNK